MHQKEMNPGCRIQDQLNTNEPTAPYITGRELNLIKLPGRQWESTPQPSEQLRPMTIKTGASTETATTAYITDDARNSMGRLVTWRRLFKMAANLHNLDNLN